MADDNPYQPPTEASIVEPPSDSDSLPIATESRRFVNLVLDVIAVKLLAVALGYIMVMAGLSSWFREPLDRLLFGVLVLLLYYVPLELFCGRTLAKFMTGTKVVSADGTRPTPAQIVNRTFFRIDTV